MGRCVLACFCISFFVFDGVALVDEMGSRIDDLEKSIGIPLFTPHNSHLPSSNAFNSHSSGDLMTQAGIEEQGAPNDIPLQAARIRIHPV
jgi:hypothetical protein